MQLPYLPPACTNSRRNVPGYSHRAQISSGRTPTIIIIVFCVLSLIPSCTGTDLPAQNKEPEWAFDSLQVAWEHFRKFEYPQADTSLTRLEKRLSFRSSPADAPEIFARLHHLRSFLYYDLYYDRDTLRRHAFIAVSIPESRLSDLARAERALVRANLSYHEWAHAEMLLFASYGLQLIGRLDDPPPLLNATLLRAKATALKKIADDHTDPALRERYYRSSERTLLSALDLLRPYDPTRTAYLFEELGILQTRFATMDELLPNVVDSIDRYVTLAADSAYVHPARLLGYWHNRGQRPDSAVLYYSALIAGGPYLRAEYMTEAPFNLRKNQLLAGRWEEALETAADLLTGEGCCPPEAPFTADLCTRKLRCIHGISHYAGILLQRGQATHNQDDVTAAFRLSQLCLEYYERELSSLNTESMLSRLVTLGDRLINIALETHYAMYRQSNDDPEIRSALFRAAELGKAHLLVRDIQEIQGIATTSADRIRTDQLREINQQLELLKARVRPESSFALDELIDFSELVYRRDTFSLAARLDLSRTPSLSWSETYSSLSLSDLQEHLQGTDVFIEFAETEGRTVAIYATRDAAKVYEIDNATMEQADRFMTLIQDPETDTTILSVLSRQLCRDLLGPVIDDILTKKNLFFVPSLSLSSFPISALVTSSQKASTRYLVEDVAIHFMESWRVTRLQATPEPRLQKDRTVGVWTSSELQYYFQDLNKVISQLAAYQPTFYDGHTASSQTFLENSHRYRHLQLSLHGFGEDNRLNNNYLYFSREDSLNGIEIGALQLDVETVFLAACSTGVGFRGKREGTFSLRRSFHRAGVPYVLSSSYNVPASATASLLGDMYRALDEGLPLASALAKVQRRYIHGDYREAWRHPYYWAGMILG